VSSHHHLLVSELSSNILGRRSRDLGPSLGQQSAASEHKHEIEESSEGIGSNLSDRVRGRDVIAQSSNWNSGSIGVLLPRSKEVHKQVAWKSSVEHLREEIEIGDESTLQNDGHIAGVEQLDGI